MFDYTKDSGQIGVNHEQIVPHPDGKAWSKCCRDGEIAGSKVDCAFIRDQEYGARLTIQRGTRRYDGCGDISSEKIESVPFMCAHRSTDDGYHRVCAGWDACFGNKSRRSA